MTRQKNVNEYIRVYLPILDNTLTVICQQCNDIPPLSNGVCQNCPARCSNGRTECGFHDKKSKEFEHLQKEQKPPVLYARLDFVKGGEILREGRDKKDLSQVDVQEKSELYGFIIRQPKVSEIETGKLHPHVSQVAFLVRLYHLSDEECRQLAYCYGSPSPAFIEAWYSELCKARENPIK